MTTLTDSDSGVEERFRGLAIRKCSIADLPAEILVFILLELEWKDVIRIRRTCKALNGASKDKSVWFHLYETSFPGIQKRLDYPFGLHSLTELENCVVRGLKANLAWKSDGPAEWIQRDILGEKMDWYWLSESGRWLVVLTAFGSVVYHDLDTLDVPGRTLIPRPGQTRRHMSTRMAVDVCPGTAKLEFNLALYLSSKPDESHFEVWKVRLQLENEGELPVLVAEKLASFEREQPGTLVCHVSLLGDDLAYSQCSLTQGSSVVSVVDWKTAPAQSTGHNYGMHQMYPSEAEALYIPVHLLPGSQIFVMTSYNMQLFDYGVAHGQPCIELWHKHSSFLKEFTLSHPYICPETNSVRMVVSEERRVLGCIIPLSLSRPSDADTDAGADAPPYSASHTPCGVVLLFEHGRTFHGKRWRGSFGYRTGVVHCESKSSDPVRDSKLYTLSYSWPDDEDPQVNRCIERVRPGRWQGWQLGFNELSGRVALFSSNKPGSCISILELQRLHP